MINLQNTINNNLRQNVDDIAIVGLSFQLPGANTLEQLDELFEKGEDQITFPSNDRKKLMEVFLEDEKQYRFIPGAYLENIDQFDYNFFKITKLDAELMDPYQRLFLQCSYRTFLDAGLTKEKLKNSRTGVYVGFPQKHEYYQLVKKYYPKDAMMAATGNISSVIASRISYVLGLQGPAELIDTACSSSLVALTQACDDINNDRCDMALVGGLNLLMPNAVSMDETEEMPAIISSNFRTKTYSEDSDGTGFGEAVVAILVKRLKRAVRDQNHIYAVIKGCAVNNDGFSQGITAPNQEAQIKVICDAQKRAGVMAKEISYIEGHGTGTELGDPIELTAAKTAFEKSTKKKQFCAIGSSKSYFGHPDSAAGLVGLVKCLTSLTYKKLYPNANFLAPTQKFDFLDSPFYVPNQTIEWQPMTEGALRTCAVSAFGLSGTNCHIIVQEFKKSEKECQETETFVANTQNASDKLSLSSDPFAPKSVWIKKKKAKIAEVKGQTNQMIEDTSMIESKLKSIVAEIFGAEPTEIEKDLDFFDLGFDSISIVQLKHAVMDSFQLDIDIELFVTDCNTVEKLAYYIGQNASVQTQDHSQLEPQEKLEQTDSYERFKQETPQMTNSQRIGDDSLQQLFHRQMDIMEQQLQLLSQNAVRMQPSKQAEAKVGQAGKTMSQNVKKESSSIQVTEEMIKDSYMKRFLVKKNHELTKEQTAFLSEFSKEYCSKLKNSILCSKDSKTHWANSRFVQGYSDVWRDMSFPIMSTEAHGVTMIDVDQNHFLDFCMGFGVNLFGYNHPLIAEALKNCIDSKLVLGPITNEAAEVAEMICKVTKTERVAFCNSGTEAIMNIVRVARGATNRKKIAVFKGSYHGTFDGVYVTSNGRKTVPVSIGTTEGMVEDVVVLEYGSGESLTYIAENSSDIAAVLVEPIQSRNPDLQPKEFLKSLRKITKEHKIILVFDEIINGFRLALGGAQEYYGIQADMVAYGKIIGGGLPIGVYAGKAEYMDRIDGGSFDQQSPTKMVVQTAGTFCHHPLAMEAAKTVLHYLYKDNGRLQKRLNYKVRTMADFMNAMFAQYKIPMHIAVGGSQFLILSEDTTMMRMLYYLLIYHNIYIWEGGTCYLSSEHTDQDILTLVSTVIKCLSLLEEKKCYAFGGFKDANHEDILHNLEEKLAYDDEDISCLVSADRAKAYQLLHDCEIEAIVPVTPMQQLVLTENICGRRDGADVVAEEFVLQGTVNTTLLQNACDMVVREQPVLRSEYEWRKWKEPVQITYWIEQSNYYFESLVGLTADEQMKTIQNVIEDNRKEGFGGYHSKIKFYLWKMNETGYRFAMIYWNSLFDGWSSSCLIGKIFTYYMQLSQENRLSPISSDQSFLQYAIALHNKNKTEELEFWSHEFDDCKESLVTMEEKKEQTSYEEGQYSFRYTASEANRIRQQAKQYKSSVSAMMQTAYIQTKAEVWHTNEVLVGMVFSGRNNSIPNIDTSIGLYTSILPMFYEIAEGANIPVKVLNHCVDHDVIAYLNFPRMLEKQDGSSIQITGNREIGNLNISRRIYVELGESIHVICKYNKNVYEEDTIRMIMERYKAMIDQMMS